MAIPIPYFSIVLLTMQNEGAACWPPVPLTGRNCILRLRFMEVHLTPEQQHQPAELASQRGRDAGTLALEAITRYLAEEARFIEAVKLGEAALERGEYLTHEQVGKRIDRLFES